jgi:predicted nucleic acid-binding protein
VNRARNGRAFAIAFLDALDFGFCGVERVSKGDENLAIDLVRSHEDKTYSLCDAVSFVVMARLGITDAIAFDRHFAEYGRFALL